MIDEQLSDDGDIAVVQLLGAGAMHYAEKTVLATVGKPRPGTNALEVLARARQLLVNADQLPMFLASALRDLQVTAVYYTVQQAISDGHGDPESLRQLESKLVAALEQGAAHTAESLSERALDYVHQIVFAKDNHVPIGSDAVERALTELQIAGVVFTTQLAIAEGHDPERLRQLEGKLVEKLASYGGS